MTTIPTLDAYFQPQQWIHDNAVDCALSVKFDAAMPVMGLNVHQLKRLVSEANSDFGRDLDIIAENFGFIGRGTDQHDGPFYVNIDASDLADFLFAIGVRDLSSLDEETWTAVKNGDPQPSATPGIA